MSDLILFLQSWIKKYPDIKYIRDIKSGKEASLILVQIESKLRCIKIYNRLSMAIKGENIYLAGKFYRLLSEKKAVVKRNKFGKNLLKRLWIKREYFLLNKLSSSGALVPHVYDYNQNSIIMEYIGTKNIPAPMIKDVSLTQKEAKKAFVEVIKSIKIFYDNGIVHGDLSEFNILWWHHQPFIIDFPQAIDIRVNSNYLNLLNRDIDRVIHFFKKWILINKEEILSDILNSSKQKKL